jgi:hypothetical protein
MLFSVSTPISGVSMLFSVSAPISGVSMLLRMATPISGVFILLPVYYPENRGIYPTSKYKGGNTQVFSKKEILYDLH